MGYDLTAYFNVNQEQIDEFINENNIDIKNSKEHSFVVDYYKTKNPEMKEMEIMYHWNRNCHSATVNLRTIAPGATVCDLRTGDKL